MVVVITLVVTVLASLAKVRREPKVLETHDVTGHHHPPGEGLQHLAELHPEGQPHPPAPGPGDPEASRPPPPSGV